MTILLTGGIKASALALPSVKFVDSSLPLA